LDVRSRIIGVGILAAHVALTVWLSAVLNVWVDEAYTLHTTSLGLTHVAKQALTWELQPPLYFVLLASWRLLNGSILWARLLSVLAVALAVWASGTVASRYLGERCRLWVMAFVAFNPFVVFCATEMRVYGLAFLWSVLLMLTFHDGYLGAGSQSDRRARVLFALVAITALYTQYFTGFLLPAFLIVLIARRRWAQAGALSIWLALAGACLLPLAPFLSAEVRTNSVSLGRSNSFLSNLFHTTGTLYHDALPTDWAPHGVSILIRIGGIAALTLLAWRSDKATLARVALDPWIVFGVSTVLFAAATTIAHAEVNAHYADALHIALYIALFAVASSLPGARGQRVLGWSAMVLVFVGCAALTSLCRHPAKLGDWSRVAAYVTAHEVAGERIVVFNSQSALALGCHYHGPNPIVPLPQPVRFDRYDLHDNALHSQEEVVRGLDYRPGVHARLWLATSAGCPRTPVNFHCELLEDFVAQHYDVELDQAFFGSRVRLLRARS